VLSEGPSNTVEFRGLHEDLDACLSAHAAAYSFKTHHKLPPRKGRVPQLTTFLNIIPKQTVHLFEPHLHTSAGWCLDSQSDETSEFSAEHATRTASSISGTPLLRAKRRLTHPWLWSRPSNRLHNASLATQLAKLKLVSEERVSCTKA
jgi:hypothetical protein